MVTLCRSVFGSGGYSTRLPGKGSRVNHVKYSRDPGVNRRGALHNYFADTSSGEAVRFSVIVRIAAAVQATRPVMQ